MEKVNFEYTFDIIIHDNINISKSLALLSILYNNGFVDYCNHNSIYGTLKKSIFNIPVGTPIKISISNQNIVTIYYIHQSKFHSFLIELVEEII
jgi:hypothetical protein